MQKRAVLTFTLLALTACFLSYKLGSTPSVLARSHAMPQDEAANVPPPLPAPPAEWVLSDFEYTKVASVTRAGVAGVQHVVDCVSVTEDDTGTAGTAYDGRAELLDGSTVVMTWDVPATYYATGAGQVSLCGISVVGTAGNGMTLEFIGRGTGVEQSVNLIGHDAT